MKTQTVKTKFKRAVVEVSQDYFSDEGWSILKDGSEVLDDFIVATFVIANGEFYEIIDDSENDEVVASKTMAKIDSATSESLIVSVESEFVFNMHKQLTTEELIEWQEENDLFSFGISLSINPKYLDDEDEVESYEIYMFDDFSISII